MVEAQVAAVKAFIEARTIHTYQDEKGNDAFVMFTDEELQSAFLEIFEHTVGVRMSTEEIETALTAMGYSETHQGVPPSLLWLRMK